MDKQTWHLPSENTIQISALARRVEELRGDLRSQDPQKLATVTGSTYAEGGFHLNLFTQSVFLSFPELNSTEIESGNNLPISLHALLLYYFNTSDGSPLTGKWISFAELPNGRTYNQAYQGYTGDLLARQYGVDLPGFEYASRLLRGGRIYYGDSGYAFQSLPFVSLLAVLWQKDDEFPASGKVLFDASVVNHLPTDVCAILGSLLTKKLLAAQG